MSPTAIAYQATDLARNSREVIDAAREGGALIRDKDGVALKMLLAEEIEHTSEINEWSLDLLRVAQVVAEGQINASATRYGGFGWLSVLPREAQRRFVTEMTEALIQSATGLSLRPVRLLLGDWRATAESWADPATREQLLEEAPEPLYDVSL